jgi:antitoxin MazE
MKAKVVRIGSSRRVRIPKAVLEGCRSGEHRRAGPAGWPAPDTPIDRPRQGWDEAFWQMAERGDDELMFAP